MTAAPVVTTTTAPAVVLEPNAECMPLLDARVAAQQRFVDEYASMSLEELATLPEAPSLFIPSLGDPEGEPIEGTFYATGEEPPEILALVELTERCYLDLFLAPVLGAARVDQKSPAGAIAWSTNQTSFLFYGELLLGSDEALERFGDKLDSPTPVQPNLPDPEVSTCTALEQVVLDGTQSAINNASWAASEFVDERADWVEAIDRRAMAIDCQGPFFARTITTNGHELVAASFVEVRERAFIVLESWGDSWESFRP